MKSMNDDVFGELTYKYGWVCRKEIRFWGKEIEFKIKIVTYEEEVVLKSQREDYIYFLENLDEISEKTYVAVQEYLKMNSEEIYSIMETEDIEELMSLVIPKTLIFDENHVMGILCECDWDDDGIGIQVIPEIVVDTQDFLL